jgi:hypothetical protein
LILCNLFIPSSDTYASSPCDRSFATAQPVGKVVLDTDSSYVQFGLTDLWLQISSLAFYMGNTLNPCLAGNDSRSVRAWYHPYGRQAAIQVPLPWRVGSGAFISAYASVCWGSTNTSTPTAVPTLRRSPVAPTYLLSDELPACPLQRVLPSIPSSPPM